MPFYITAPYLTSTLDNSTKVNSIYGEERIKQVYHYYPFREDIVSRRGFNITCPVPMESKVKVKGTTVDNIYNEAIKRVKSMPSTVEPLTKKEIKDLKVSIVSCKSKDVRGGHPRSYANCNETCRKDCEYIKKIFRFH